LLAVTRPCPASADAEHSKHWRYEYSGRRDRRDFSGIAPGAATAADALQARAREETNKLPRPSRRYGDIERALRPVLPR